jgi:hypothetical protein
LVIALWPYDPIAVKRIWCLYELWCAIEMKIPITAGFTDTHRKCLLCMSCFSSSLRCCCCFNNEIIKVDVEQAKATIVEDTKLILNIVREYPGVEETNKQLSTDFQKSILLYKKHARKRIWMYFCFMLVCIGVVAQILEAIFDPHQIATINSKNLLVRVYYWTSRIVCVSLITLKVINVSLPRAYAFHVSAAQFWCMFVTILILNTSDIIISS